MLWYPFQLWNNNTKKNILQSIIITILFFLPIHTPGSFNINTQQKTSAVVSTSDTPDSLDIDHALILLDPQAEKILSSINMEALHSLGGGVKPMTTPTELIGEVTPEVTPSGEAISAIGGGVGSVDIPVDTPPLPSATSSPYMRPQRPFMRLPGGPRFRPRLPHFEQPPYRTRGPFNPRGPPRMDRGGFRPRWWVDDKDYLT